MVLFFAGLLLGVWLLLSMRWRVWAIAPWPMEGAWVESHEGVFWFVVIERTEGPGSELLTAGITRIPAPDALPGNALWPHVQRVSASYYTTTSVAFPLWLLAAVCLAWPVTSFLVRRRRRGRGFEVEAKR